MKLEVALKNFEIRPEGPREWSECWYWLGTIDATGRARVYVNGRSHRGSDRAAHVFYEHFHGPAPARLHVLHKCHNKACVNPAHLYAGTNVDNNRDTDMAGLRKRPRTAKLTDAQCEVIRASKASGMRLAAIFGVNQSTISRIRTRDTYKRPGK